VQMLAGHTNLRTTQRYIDANPDAQNKGRPTDLNQDDHGPCVRLLWTPRRCVERCFLHVPDSHLLATKPPDFSLEDWLPSSSTLQEP
jgi:hypothetical protein